MVGIDQQHTKQTLLHWALLLAILGLAAVARVLFLAHGLPENPYVDAARFVQEAYAMAHQDSWQPRFFVYPGLFKTLLSVCYSVTGAQETFALHFVARLIAAFFGTLTVAIVYLLACTVVRPSIALVATALAAVDIVAISIARVEAADSTMLFFFTVAVWLLSRAATSPGPDGAAERNKKQNKKTVLGTFLAAGVTLGLAAGTKYSGGYAAVALVFFALWTAWRTRSWATGAQLIAVGGVAASLTFLATTPWFITHHEDYLLGLRLQSYVQSSGALGQMQNGYLDYLLSPLASTSAPWMGDSLYYNFGPHFVLVAVLALIMGCAGRLGGRTLIFSVLILLFLALVVGPGRVKAARYILPVMPLLYVVVAAAFDKMLSLRLSRLQRGALVLLAVSLFMVPVWQVSRFVALSGAPSSNDIVRNWATQNIPAGSTVLLSPFYAEDLRSLNLRFLLIKLAGQRQYRLPPEMGNSTERDPLFSPQLLEESVRGGARWVVLNSYFEAGLYDTEENRRWFPVSVAAYRAFRQRLEQVADRVLQVQGYQEGRLGPDITVYRMR